MTGDLGPLGPTGQSSSDSVLYDETTRHPPPVPVSDREGVSFRLPTSVLVCDAETRHQDRYRTVEGVGVKGVDILHHYCEQSTTQGPLLYPSIDYHEIFRESVPPF